MVRRSLRRGNSLCYRLKRNAVTTPDPKHRGRKSPGVLLYQRVQLKGVAGIYCMVEYRNFVRYNLIQRSKFNTSWRGGRYGSTKYLDTSA